MTAAFWTGTALGFVAAQVGPVWLLCARTTLRAGFASGFGIGLASLGCRCCGGGWATVRSADDDALFGGAPVAGGAALGAGRSGTRKEPGVTSRRLTRVLAAAVALLAVVACSGDDPKPPSIQGVEVFEDLSHKHVTNDVTYAQTPPVGGEHAPVWLRCAVYAEQVPEENAVHSMEHGAIWITYDPALSQDEVRRLSRLQGLKPEYVLISPFQGLPSTVVASTWGLRLKADTVDDPRLADFVKEYAGGNQGGEKGADCVGATLDQIKAGAGSAM